MGASASTLAKLGISESNPVDAAFDFISESVGKRGSIVEHDGIRGTRSRQGERTRAGTYSVGGTISMQPSPEELAALLPWILGAAASGTTYALAETLSSRYVTIDKVAKVCTYAGCYVNRATFSSGENSPLSLELEIVGQTETVGNAGTFPSLLNGNTGPFVHHDATGTFVSGSRSFKRASLTIDNRLIVAHNNSQSASFIVPGDRMISVSLETPWSSAEVDLHDQAAAGYAATLSYAYNNYSLSFALANLQVPSNTPEVGGRGQEITLKIEGMARMASTTKELVVTLDSTP